MRKIFLPALILAAAGIMMGYWYWQRAQQSTDDTQLTLHGNVDIRQVQLAFNGSERIVAMHAREGQQVQRGELLAELDSRRLEQAVAEAEARVDAQAQVLAALEAGTRAEELNKLRADLQAAQVDADNARRNARRLQDLAKRKLASQEQADNARALADTADAHLEAVRQALALGEAGPRQEDVAAAAATLQALKANLALARQALADGQLHAPADGVIRDRILEPGDMASPQTPVYTLALTDPLWVRAFVDEPDLGKLHLGMLAEVTSDSFPDKRYQGWVGYISPTAEFTPKSVQTARVRTALVYQVRVFVCDANDELRLGMPAEVHIDLGQTSAAETEPPCPASP
jgi:HlyD family secretion protein